MSQYQIVEQLDGLFRAEMGIQDGTEFQTLQTYKDAEDWLVRGARIMNGVKIRRSKIRFGREVTTAQVQIVEAPKPNRQAT